MSRKSGLASCKFEISALFFVILLFQFNFTFSDYAKVSEFFHRFDTYASSTIETATPQPINIKYYDNKYSKNFQIKFSFLATAPGGNLFQTDNEGSGIRLELVPSSTPEEFTLLLQYRAWDGERFLFTTKNLMLNRLYFFDLNLSNDNQIQLKIDNREILRERISKQDIRYKRFILGAGLSGSRVFDGYISNATLILQTSERKSLVPINILILAILVFFSLLFGRVVFNSRRLLDRTSVLRELSVICLLVTLALRLNFQRSFSKFFGDDFLMLWPIRGSDPLTIFTESIGPQYRPLTELLLLLRFELHGLNLSSWEMGSKLLTALLSVHLYWFLRQKIKLGVVLAFLTCLTYVTSIQFLGSALWWASVGTQHLLSQLLTIHLLSSIIDYFRENYSKTALNRVVFRGLLLALTSEIFIPILVLTPILLIVLGQIAKGGLLFGDKKKISRKILRKAIFRNLLSDSVPFIVTVIAFFLFRLIVVQVDRVVAASSAKNFTFNSFSLMSSINQYLEYVLSFSGGIFGVHFYDYGAKDFRLMSFFDYGQGLKLLTICLTLVGTLIFITNVTSWWNRHLMQWGGEQGLNFSLIVVLAVSILVPSLVPDYQQIRWVQLSFLIYLILIVKVRKSITKMELFDFYLIIFLLFHLIANIILIRNNFSVDLFP